MSKGIYAYTDKKNNEIVYVGKDSNIHMDKRHKAHFEPSRYDVQPFNRILQNNPDRYEYRVLVELSDDFSDNDLKDLEEHFIEKLKTYHYENPNGFNFTRGGDGTPGHKWTEKHRKKQSKIRKSEEYRKKLSEKAKERWEDDDFRKKMSKIMKSEEYRKKLSKVNKGKNNPFYNRKHTEESKIKMSKNHADVSGENNPQAKYSLWDILYVQYNKGKMFRGDREPNPCSCFGYKYNGYRLPIGLFKDFVTPEIINNLVSDAIDK